MYRPRSGYVKPGYAPTARRRKRNRTKYFLIGAAVLLVLAAVVAVILLFPPQSIEDSFSEMPFSPADQFDVTASGVAVISGDQSGDHYYLYDYNFELVSDNVLLSPGMTMTTSDSLFGAYNGEMLQTVDKTGKVLYTARMSGIVKAVMGTERAAVFCQTPTEAGGTASTIHVLDADGNEISVQPFDDQNVIDFGFYGTNEMLWVLSLDTSGSMPTSRITMYNPGKTMTGIRNFLDQLIEQVVFDSENIYACGTTNINVSSLFETETANTILVYGWRYLDHAFENDVPIFLYIPREDSVNGSFKSIKLVMTNNSSVSLNLPEECQDAVIYKSKLYCLSTGNIHVYSLDGVFERTMTFPYSYDAVLDAGQGYAFYQKGEQVYALPLS